MYLVNRLLLKRAQSGFCLGEYDTANLLITEAIDLLKKTVCLH